MKINGAVFLIKTMTDVHRALIFYVTCIIIVGALILFLELFGSPTRRGFFCNDTSILYPLHKNTISESAVVIICLVVPFLTIVLTEIWSHGTSLRTKHTIFSKKIPKWLLNVLKLYCGFIVGLGLHQFLSSIGKFTIGRLRPHFIAVCKPLNLTCETGSFVTNYKCTGNHNEVLESRQSFPSGHAAVSFYTAIFLIIYLSYSSKWVKCGYLKIIVQYIFITGAWWIALTRVMDYWHFPSDVISGALLGGVAAYLTAKYICKINDFRTSEMLPLRRSNSTGSCQQRDI